MHALRVARYLRVSRHDQDTALQADETAAFVKNRKWKLVESYKDHGISGAKDRRPQLDRLLADARARKWDALVVYKADRLFRSLRHMVLTLDEFAALGSPSSRRRNRSTRARPRLGRAPPERAEAIPAVEAEELLASLADEAGEEDSVANEGRET